MNFIKYFAIVLVAFCTNKNTVTDKYIDKDSVVVKLKQLKETELTRIEFTPGIFFLLTL